ncbi:MAG: hypothetical protein RR841_00430 [Eubacterium sp.]
MKKRIVSIVLSILMVLSSVSLPVMAQEEIPVSYGTPGIDYIEGEVIACVNGGASALTGKARGAETFQVEELMDVSGAANPMARSMTKESLVFVKSSQDTASLIAELQSNPNVKYAEPNYIMVPYVAEDTEPNDPYYKYQWAFKNQMNLGGVGNPTVDANVSDAWEKVGTTITDTPVVAVIDSGVDYNHPDLKNIMWSEGDNIPELKALGGGTHGYNSNTNEVSSDPMDVGVGHGTH